MIMASWPYSAWLRQDPSFTHWQKYLRKAELSGVAWSECRTSLQKVKYYVSAAGSYWQDALEAIDFAKAALPISIYKLCSHSNIHAPILTIT